MVGGGEIGSRRRDYSGGVGRGDGAKGGLLNPLQPQIFLNGLIALAGIQHAKKLRADAVHASLQWPAMRDGADHRNRPAFAARQAQEKLVTGVHRPNVQRPQTSDRKILKQERDGLAEDFIVKRINDQGRVVFVSIRAGAGPGRWGR